MEQKTTSPKRAKFSPLYHSPNGTEPFAPLKAPRSGGSPRLVLSQLFS